MGYTIAGDESKTSERRMENHVTKYVPHSSVRAEDRLVVRIGPWSRAFLECSRAQASSGLFCKERLFVIPSHFLLGCHELLGEQRTSTSLA